MDDCLQQLMDRIDAGEGEQLKNLILSERLAKLVRMRLEMQAPYISKWPQALSIQVCSSILPLGFWVYFSHMDVIPSVLYLTVSTSKRLNKLEAASCPGWWDLACSWRYWIRYWLVCEAYCAWWYLLNLWGVYVDGQFSRFALLQNTIGFLFLFIASDFRQQFDCLTLTASIELKKDVSDTLVELPVV